VAVIVFFAGEDTGYEVRVARQGARGHQADRLQWAGPVS
jgi:hypothetical protein